MQHVEPAEQVRQPGRHRLFQQDEIESVAVPQRHEPRQHLRQLHDGEQLLGPQPAVPLQHGPQIELPVVEVGRRMAGVDGHRRQNRKSPLVEEAVQFFALRHG